MNEFGKERGDAGDKAAASGSRDNKEFRMTIHTDVKNFGSEPKGWEREVGRMAVDQDFLRLMGRQAHGCDGEAHA